MEAIEITDLARMDAAVEALPNGPAVFALWPAEGEPYLARTALLRRRLLRLLREREKPGRMLNLRHTVSRIEYRLTASSLESSAVLYEKAKLCFPSNYLDRIRLRMPSYVKVAVAADFPRSSVTTHLARSGVYYGPFSARAAAERFEGQFLDLFQMRRCQEDLVPSPDHPGCIYGEMGMCLRPCQEVVGPEEYGFEVGRAVEFLRTEGRSLMDAIVRSRDRLSEEMQFEEAARQHKRLEKVLEALKSAGEMAREIDRLNGVAITRSTAPESVEMWLVRDGEWAGSTRFNFGPGDGKMVSLDRRLRDELATVTVPRRTVRERQEYMALLARWFYSSWRDGEWLPFETYEEIPYRKLVNAISRVAHREVKPE